jgi:microcystin-dependent protein
MSTPFIGEIQIYAFNFPPKSWAMCNGQLLPINQNQALFSLLGTTYGGNGQTNFSLPNLQGRVAVSQGNGFPIGQQGGETSHTVTVSEMPFHSHAMLASSNPADASRPGGNVLAIAEAAAYESLATPILMAPGSGGNQVVGNTGGNQPHENRQPFLTLNFCIALQGIFPSPN